MINKFTKNIISLTSPAFVEAGGDDGDILTFNASEDTASLLIVDILTGWTCIAHMSLDAFDASLMFPNHTNHMTMLEKACKAIRECSRPSVRNTNGALLELNSVVTAAIRTGTAYSSMVESNGNASGYWFYIGYQLYDGAYTAHPAFLPRHCKIENVSNLMYIIKRMVEQHLISMHAATKNSLGLVLRKGGGPILPIKIY